MVLPWAPDSMADPIRGENPHATKPDPVGDVVDAASRVEAAVSAADVLDAIPDAVIDCALHDLGLQPRQCLEA